MATTAPRGDDEIVIYRRFRRVRGGRVLDAWKYGIRAWPIRVRKRNK